MLQKWRLWPLLLATDGGARILRCTTKSSGGGGLFDLRGCCNEHIDGVALLGRHTRTVKNMKCDLWRKTRDDATLRPVRHGDFPRDFSSNLRILHRRFEMEWQGLVNPSFLDYDTKWLHSPARDKEYDHILHISTGWMPIKHGWILGSLAVLINHQSSIVRKTTCNSHSTLSS